MIVDGAILFTLFFFAFRSYRGKLQGEIAGASGWILAILLAFALTDAAAALINHYVKSSDLATISGYLSFLLLLVGARALMMWGVQAFPSNKGGFFFNAIPVLLGLFKGAFFLSAFFLMISTTSLQSKVSSHGTGAMIYPRIINFSSFVVRTVTRNVPKVDGMMRRLAPAESKKSQKTK